MARPIDAEKGGENSRRHRREKGENCAGGRRTFRSIGRKPHATPGSVVSCLWPRKGTLRSLTGIAPLIRFRIEHRTLRPTRHDPRAILENRNMPFILQWGAFLLIGVAVGLGIFHLPPVSR